MYGTTHPGQFLSAMTRKMHGCPEPPPEPSRSSPSSRPGATGPAESWPPASPSRSGRCGATSSGYQLAAGASLPPLVLDDDEAVALVVGLHTNAALADEGVAEASVRALAKTLTFLPPRLRRRADALRASTDYEPWRDPTGAVSPRVLDAIAGACHDVVVDVYSQTSRDVARIDR